MEKLHHFETNICVRYGETDQMGVVHHANYVHYMEIGRTEWLRNLGFTYKSMEQQGVLLPVIKLELDYKKSAYYDDVLTIITRLKQLPSAFIEFEYELKDTSKNLLAIGYTKLVFISNTTKKPMRCPSYLLDKLK